MTQDRDIEVGDEVPEADALEQARPVAPLSSAEQPVIDVEVPEADALEQAQVVTWDDEDAESD